MMKTAVRHLLFVLLLVLSKGIHTTEVENNVDNTVQPQEVVRQQPDVGNIEPIPAVPTVTVNSQPVEPQQVLKQQLDDRINTDPKPTPSAANYQPAQPQEALREQADNRIHTEPKLTAPTANVNSKPVQQTRPALQGLSQLAMIAQINRLADKVMKAHGVTPDSPNQGNLKNIQHLRQVVANVETKLETKLREKANSNQAVPTANTQSQVTEEARQNIATVNNAEVIDDKVEVQIGNVKIQVSEEGIISDERSAPDITSTESKNIDINNLEAKRDVSDEENQEIPLQTDDIQPTKVNYAEVDKEEVIVQSKSESEVIATETIQTTIYNGTPPTQATEFKQEETEIVAEEIHNEIKTPGEELSQEESTTANLEKEAVQTDIKEDTEEENLQIEENDEEIDAALKSDADSVEADEAVSETGTDEDETVMLTEEEHYSETCDLETDDCNQGNENSHVYSAEYNEKILTEEVESTSESGYISGFFKYIYQTFV